MSTHANEEEEDEFIKITEKEDSEFMEFPKEEDGTVLLCTIQSQFANAIGLKYKGPSGAWRAVREVEDALVAPKGGWGDQVYCITFSETKRRKNENCSFEGDDNEFIKIIEKEDSDFMEFPKEEDGTVLLHTIQTQFANVIGLKYKGPSGAWRAVRGVEDVLVAPKGGWGDQVYSITFSETTKRKNDTADSGESDRKYNKTFENSLLRESGSVDSGEWDTRDINHSRTALKQCLLVLGIPDATKQDELREYFESKYGELGKCDLKIDRGGGKSVVFGVIRFKDKEHARAALTGENFMNGHRIFVKQRKEKPMRMHVSGLPEGTTQKDLVEYFNQFGRVIAYHIFDKPIYGSNDAVFTFYSSKDGCVCLKMQHIFRGTRLTVKSRDEPKPKYKQKQKLAGDAAQGGNC